MTKKDARQIPFLMAEAFVNIHKVIHVFKYTEFTHRVLWTHVCGVRFKCSVAGNVSCFTPVGEHLVRIRCSVKASFIKTGGRRVQ